MLDMMCVTWRSEPATLARAKTCRAGAGRREGVSRGLVLFACLLCASAAAAGRGGTNAVHANSTWCEVNVVQFADASDAPTGAALLRAAALLIHDEGWRAS